MLSEENYKEFDGRNILVIGGAGFVGSNLVRLLLEQAKPARITVIDNLLSSEKSNVPEDPIVEFVEGSISDDRILFEVNDTYHYIFHLATYHGNQSSIFNPLADHENNTLTTLKLLERVHRYKKLIRLVYSSAGCSVAKKTFDGAEATTEEAPICLEQDSPYSLSKIFGEFYCVYYYRQYNFPAVRARFQNVYGPGEILGAGQWRGTPATVWRNVTPTFIYKSLLGETLPLENGGVASRDFIYVEDICRGLCACAIRGLAGSVYNIASGRETTIAELAQLINCLTGNAAPPEMKPRRSWDNSGKRFGSTDKAAGELGFSAAVPLRDGLEKTVLWTKKNMALIKQTIAKHAENMEKC